MHGILCQQQPLELGPIDCSCGNVAERNDCRLASLGSTCVFPRGSALGRAPPSSNTRRGAQRVGAWASPGAVGTMNLGGALYLSRGARRIPCIHMLEGTQASTALGVGRLQERSTPWALARLISAAT
jgi:hypothetical protein